MYFNHGDADGADAIGKSDGSVGVGTRIHHHGIELAVGLLELVDEAAFVIRLVIRQLVLGKALPEVCQIVLKRNLSVNFRLAFSKQVEVGTIDDENVHGFEVFAKVVISVGKICS